MEKRTKKLSLRLSPQEYNHLKRQAELAGMKMEPMLRKLVMGVELRPRPPDQYAALLRELSAIGNNLNQIAHWANGQHGLRERELQNAIALMQQAWRLLKEKL